MNTKQIDYLNILLMLVSFIVALKLPFELFLFSYAVLGPLHYLTEINWLNQKDYFMPEKRDFKWLVVLSILVSAIVIFNFMGRWEWSSTMLNELDQENLHSFKSFIYPWGIHITFIAFLSCFIFLTVKNNAIKYALIAAVIIAAYFINDAGFYVSLFGIFLPTIIHVCIFTALFMLSGALRSNQFSGYLTIVAYVGFLMAILLMEHKFVGYNPTDYIRQSFNDSGFGSVTYSMMQFFDTNQEANLLSRIGLKMQAFIAFVYTYHYLNWFSKTNVIGWLRVPKIQLITSLGIWIAAILLYIMNYRVGLAALMFLSMLHVYLEFPLNFKSISDIFKLSSQRLSGKKI